MVRHRAWLFAAAGGCFGLLVLTKPETSLAACAAIVVGWMAAALLGFDDRRNLAGGVPAFLAAAAVPPLLFAVDFLTCLPIGDALRATAGAWTEDDDDTDRENIFFLRRNGDG
jgi:hypothetical protein